MEHLRNTLLRYCDFSSGEIAVFLQHIRKKELKKNTLLIRKGQILDLLIFIDKGILSVHLNSSDNDVDCAFAFEGTFYCELSGFFRNLPSPYGIRAIEDTVLYYIKRNDMNSLYDLNPKYERLARLIWEEGMIEMSKTLVLHQTEKAKNRYIKEIENNRDLMKIPQKNISSYLGITPSSLSRIRNSPINGYNSPESNNE